MTPFQNILYLDDNRFTYHVKNGVYPSHDDLIHLFDTIWFYPDNVFKLYILFVLNVPFTISEYPESEVLFRFWSHQPIDFTNISTAQLGYLSFIAVAYDNAMLLGIILKHLGPQPILPYETINLCIDRKSVTLLALLVKYGVIIHLIDLVNKFEEGLYIVLAVQTPQIYDAIDVIRIENYTVLDLYLDFGLKITDELINYIMEVNMDLAITIRNRQT